MTTDEIRAAQDEAIEEFSNVHVRIGQAIAKVVGEIVADAKDVRVFSDVTNGSEAHQISLEGPRQDGTTGFIDSFQVIIRPRTQP